MQQTLWSGRVHNSRQQTGKGAIWLLLTLATLFSLVLYGYTTPQQVPPWAAAWLPGLPEYTGPLYRWHDYQGRVHITDQPPLQGQPYETVRYRNNVNAIPPQGGTSHP